MGSPLVVNTTPKTSQPESSPARLDCVLRGNAAIFKRPWAPKASSTPRHLHRNGLVDGCAKCATLLKHTPCFRELLAGGNKPGYAGHSRRPG